MKEVIIPLYPGLFSAWGMLATEPRSDFMQTEPLFSGGPYSVVGFEEGERISLRYNDNWWGEPPELDRVTFRRVEYNVNETAAKIYDVPELDDMLGDRLGGGR